MSKLIQLIDKIFTLVFMGVCIGIVFYTFYFYSGCSQLGDFSDFSPYDAEITAISVEQAKRDEYWKNFLYYIKVEYRYEIGEQSFTSRQASLGNAQWFNYDDAQEQVDKILDQPVAYVSNITQQSILINPMTLNEINTISIWIYPLLYFGLMILASMYTSSKKEKRSESFS